jgi:putative ABC transport system permease protein
MRDHVNAYLLGYEPGADPASLKTQIEGRFPQVTVKSVAEVIADNERVITDGFLPVLRVLLTIGFIIGVAVIGLTIYSAMLEKRREYGVLKAIGASSIQMLLILVGQALAAAAAGYVVGVGGAFLAAKAAEWWVPQFITIITFRDVALVGAAAAAMGLVSSVVPLARIASVDAAEVFRS